MKKTYRAIAYKQATDESAPWIISLVAPAEEILDWAGIPRRTEDNEMAGFQRSDDPPRVTRAKKFFEIPQNQSPTSVIVGIHKPANLAESPVSLTFDEDNTNGNQIRFCTLEINYPGQLTATDVVPYVRRQIESRIDVSAESTDEEELEFEDDVLSEEDASGDDGSEDRTEAGEHEPFELGRSLLRALYRRLDDPEWCSRNIEALNDLAKPATVIDGQHRLKGAEKCERRIPFNVCVTGLHRLVQV